MAIDRALWKRSLGETYAPPWPCPSCTKGRMRLKSETLHYEETAESRRAHGNREFHITDVTFAFSAMLECSRCDDKGSCCGEGSYVPERYPNENGNDHVDYEEAFFPRYFFKPMKIFQPPKFIPEAVIAQLHKSFEVFFCDLAAAANHVRQCLEEILDHAGFHSRNAQDRFIPLDQRIQEFAKSDHENAERAHAVRWIGNFGSHPQALTKDDVFDAYEILDVLLEDLYVGHRQSVRQMVEQINAARGPRRKGV